MLVHDFEQNSPEWYAARVGVVTASTFGGILTKTGQYSATARSIENKIVAELLTGKDDEAFAGNAHTERGHELEPDAVEFYEMSTGIETQKVGFVTNDNRTIGCSPDRLVGDEGLLEIKAPAAATHVGYLIEGSVDEKYKPQIQGQLLVTGRKWIDIFSYHPELPPSIVRVERDEEYIAKLQEALNTVLANIQTKLKKIKGETH